MRPHLKTCGRTLEHAAAPLTRSTMYKRILVLEMYAIVQLAQAKSLSVSGAS